MTHWSTSKEHIGSCYFYSTVKSILQDLVNLERSRRDTVISLKGSINQGHLALEFKILGQDLKYLITVSCSGILSRQISSEPQQTGAMIVIYKQSLSVFSSYSRKFSVKRQQLLHLIWVAGNHAENFLLMGKLFQESFLVLTSQIVKASSCITNHTIKTYCIH